MDIMSCFSARNCPTNPTSSADHTAHTNADSQKIKSDMPTCTLAVPVWSTVLALLGRGEQAGCLGVYTRVYARVEVCLQVLYSEMKAILPAIVMIKPELIDANAIRYSQR